MNSFILFCLFLGVIACIGNASSSSSASSHLAQLRTALSKSSEQKTVTFDGRSFLINGERILFIAGSVHYPRLPQSEWAPVFQLLKESGINLIQTYVFWDIHEPIQGSYYFPNDDSPNNLVKFIQTAQELGLYVNLRIGPYVCAEWSYGGLPVWLKSIKDPSTGKTIVYRTDNSQWLDAMLDFSDAVINVVRKANLFYADGGPIVMLQLENEYGNIQAAYGQDGVTYIQKLANYIATKKRTIHNLPWIMCQQGEGVGTAPPAHIINTCNGYYCDNWISTHEIAFPNQPHMFTENWPGWFQNWGDPVPHRPAVDVAFSVARWFARGGDYMNYYMAFGGTTFGRKVGGPLIITSYDYDVQVNEYAMKAEPKYSLLSGLHHLLLANMNLLLNQEIAETVAIGASYCEQHTYTGNPAAGDKGCLIFLSNWDTSRSCSFSVGGNTLTVSPWSVSILTGSTCDTASYVYSTRDSAKDIVPNEIATQKVADITLETGLCESIPPPVQTVVSTYPVEQLQITNDTTDFLWYSTSLDAATTDRNVSLSFSVASGGGGLVYVYVNNDRVSTYYPQSKMLKASIKTTEQLQATTKLSFTLPLPKDQENVITILSMTMGLQNYGANLEEVQAGIVSNITIDGVIATNWVHSIGLVGESLDMAKGKNWQTKKMKSNTDTESCNSIRWLRGSFYTKDLPTQSAHLALDMISGGLTKGAVWVNGFQLGRYWNVVADGVCAACASESYTGAYNADRCRTGCGEPSQRIYKLPVDILRSVESGEVNTIVVTEESEQIQPQSSFIVSVVEVSMQDKK